MQRSLPIYSILLSNLLLLTVNVFLSEAWTSGTSITLKRLPAATSLRMGLFDFLRDRQGDFIKLDESEKEFGPGPLMVLYNCPGGIDDQEIFDMIEDGAPTAFKQSCRIHRISSTKQPILDLPVKDALEQIVSGTVSFDDTGNTLMPMDSGISIIPVLYFSGFRNQEMMNVYNILGKEIYEETGGQSNAACAKAVPNAMQKPLRQVFDEICGDHSNAIAVVEDS